jgi:hypothetical protein
MLISLYIQFKNRQNNVWHWLLEAWWSLRHRQLRLEGAGKLGGLGCSGTQFARIHQVFNSRVRQFSVGPLYFNKMFLAKCMFLGGARSSKKWINFLWVENIIYNSNQKSIQLSTYRLMGFMFILSNSLGKTTALLFISKPEDVIATDPKNSFHIHDSISNFLKYRQ